MIKQLAAFLDLRGYSSRDLPSDLLAGLAVAVLSVPQGIAYALIAGLPPAMGLYAAALPAIIGSWFRSSRHVITGPSNAISLLVGSIIASHAGDMDPIVLATTLAVVTGIVQILAGVLRLGTIVDFISGPVVLGYITGAAVLIGVGQFRNVTGSAGESGNLLHQLATWLSGLHDVSLWSIGITAGTVMLVVGLRKIDRRIPGALVVMVLGIVLSFAIGLADRGVVTVEAIASVPRGLPPFTPPDWSSVPGLLGAAVAAVILSFVESTSVARNLASRSGQQLDTNVEFVGQGAANLLGGLFGSFVTSGSLGRSALNYRSGAKSRLAGVFSGLVILGVLLLLGPVVNLTPIPVLAGLLLLIALDLVDLKRIRSTLRATPGDALAFIVTLGGTWILSLDRAIELGVLVSLVLFLRKVRLLRITELIIDEAGSFHEVDLEETTSARLSAIRIINLEGPLFFGAAGELQRTLDSVVRTGAKAIVIRLKRTQGLDATVARTFHEIHEQLAAHGGRLVLAGMRPDTMERLQRMGVDETLGDGQLYPTQHDWFAALVAAIRATSRWLADEGNPDGRRMLVRLDAAQRLAG